VHYLPKLVGISVLTLVWDELFEIGSPYSEIGIDCVISTENQILTYRISRGVVDLR
jgi:hypothetical protein